MIKYEVKEETFEIKNRCLVDYSEKDIIDEYYNQRQFEPELVGTFNTEEEARVTFNKCYPSTYKTCCNAGWYLLAKVVFIEENEYYDDGEFFQGNTIDFKAEAFINN